MITVHKITLELLDCFSLELPKNAKILSVQSQRNKPCLWVLLDTEAEKVKRNFRLAGTGHEIEKEIASQLEFIGTFQLNEGGFIGHLFEILSFQDVLAKNFKMF